MKNSFSLEAKEEEYICESCGNVFWGRKRNKKPKYCSDKCRNEGWKVYMRRYMRRRRLSKKLQDLSISIEEFDKQLANMVREEKGIIKWTDEMTRRMQYLVVNQQFAEQLPKFKKERCWICNSEENLLIHHVKYYPKIEIKILCKSCSEFLHKSLLKGKKCRPDWFR